MSLVPEPTNEELMRRLVERTTLWQAARDEIDRRLRECSSLKAELAQARRERDEARSDLKNTLAEKTGAYSAMEAQAHAVGGNMEDRLGPAPVAGLRPSARVVADHVFYASDQCYRCGKSGTQIAAGNAPCMPWPAPEGNEKPLPSQPANEKTGPDFSPAPVVDESGEERTRRMHGLHLLSPRCWCRDDGKHLTVCTDAPAPVADEAMSLLGELDRAEKPLPVLRAALAAAEARGERRGMERVAKIVKEEADRRLHPLSAEAALKRIQSALAAQPEKTK